MYMCTWIQVIDDHGARRRYIEVNYETQTSTLDLDRSRMRTYDICITSNEVQFTGRGRRAMASCAARAHLRPAVAIEHGADARTT